MKLLQKRGSMSSHVAKITDTTVLQNIVDDTTEKQNQCKKNGIVYRDRSRILESVVMITSASIMAALGGMHLLSATGSLILAKEVIEIAWSVATLVVSVFIFLMGVNHYLRSNANSQVKEYSKVIDAAKDRIYEISATVNKGFFG